MNSDLIPGLPLHRTWLEDIVEFLLSRPNGTAEIEAIAIGVAQIGKRSIRNPEETVTRTINNYCFDARDRDKVVKHNLFERVSPNTYRLRTFPNSPDLIEIQEIKFADLVYGDFWKELNIKKSKSDPKWSSKSKREKLMFVLQETKPGGKLEKWLAEFRRRRAEMV
jgi:hypothetical protein